MLLGQMSAFYRRAAFSSYTNTLIYEEALISHQRGMQTVAAVKVWRGKWGLNE